MLVLGIDTSCDDTSASLLSLENGMARIISNVVSSQNSIHAKYGGIVPELASRRHIEAIWPVVNEALGDKRPDELDGVAVCKGPGLIGSLLVGCMFAKAICFDTGLSLVGINHLEGHLFSAFLEGTVPEYPFICLIASGGHTALYRADGPMNYEELGRTRDDAAGEAYDKVAKLLGLGYPGGPEIDRLSSLGDPKAVDLPRAYLPGSLDFSFSGLKTAVRLAVRNDPDIRKEDVAASFQASVVDVLIRKTERAVKNQRIKRVVLSGGVAANSALRSNMQAMADERGVSLHMPPASLCTDNAAMIALPGCLRLANGERAGMDLNPKAYLPL